MNRCHSCKLCLLFLRPGVNTQQQLCFLKHIPTDACCRSQFDQVGKQTLQGEQQPYIADAQEMTKVNLQLCFVMRSTE